MCYGVHVVVAVALCVWLCLFDDVMLLQMVMMIAMIVI